MLGGDDDDGGLAFGGGGEEEEKEIMGFSGGGMHLSAKVQIDRESGQITGWDQIWNLIKDENTQNVQDDTKNVLQDKI